MNFKELTLASFAAALVLSTGCVVDDDPAGDTDDTDPGTTMTVTDPTTMGPTGPTTETSTGSTTMVDPDTTDTETDTVGDTDTDTDTDTDDVDPDLYDFREDEADAYTRVDRMGFPALNTALIPEASQDAYNAGSPADDVTGTFAADAVGTITLLHGGDTAGSTGLEDDLVLAETLLDATIPGISLPPCGVIVGNDSCIEQAVPLAFPDVLLLDTTGVSGFPNGRALEVPVVDIILAAILLEVSSPAVLGSFTDLDPADDDVHGLSQSPNDVAFPGAFPYLAPAHAE